MLQFYIVFFLFLECFNIEFRHLEPLLQLAEFALYLMVFMLLVLHLLLYFQLFLFSGFVYCILNALECTIHTLTCLDFIKKYSLKFSFFVFLLVFSEFADSLCECRIPQFGFTRYFPQLQLVIQLPHLQFALYLMQTYCHALQLLRLKSTTTLLYCHSFFLKDHFPLFHLLILLSFQHFMFFLFLFHKPLLHSQILPRLFFCLLLHLVLFDLRIFQSLQMFLLQ